VIWPADCPPSLVQTIQPSMVSAALGLYRFPAWSNAVSTLTPVLIAYSRCTHRHPVKAHRIRQNFSGTGRISKLNAQGMIFHEKARSLQAADTLHHRAVRTLMGVDNLGNMDGGKVPGECVASSMVRCID